nr:family 20 glycosylhydrolase [uncultured Niameybacter sp.]
MNYNIIPQLKKVELTEQVIKLKDYVLADDLKAIVPTGETLLLEGTYTGKGTYPITYHFVSLPHQEGYRLILCEDCIQIEATTPTGVFYALTTLSELDRLNKGHLSCGMIEDYPDMDFRSVSDDISRGQVSTFEHFKSIIKRLSRFKYNVYMPYIEDVFKFNCCPDWGKYSDGLTGEEWKALVAYASDYHIAIRPIINLLGHFDKNAALKSLQALTIHDDKGHPTSVLDPLNPQVRPLIANILDEVVAAFGTGVIHVGGDEPCAITEVYGKEKGGQLFIDHFNWIYTELKHRGCSMMMYADFFAPPWGDYAVGLERALELPKDVNFVFWDYAVREDYPYVEKLHEIGLTVTVSPGTWAWNRFNCHMKTCWGNTAGLLRAAKGNANHMIMSSWGDGGDCSRELNWPGFLIGANWSWSTQTTYTFEQFYTLYHTIFLGITEEDAAQLEPVYHYDNVIGLEDLFAFKNEMYKCALNPIDFAAQEKAALLIPKMERALTCLQALKQTTQEKTVLDALYLSAQRILFTARKITLLPWESPKNREEAKAYISDILALAGELETIRCYHQKVWFDTNRLSDWNYVDMLYLDLRDELARLARHMDSDKNFNSNLGFHVFQG